MTTLKESVTTESSVSVVQGNTTLSRQRKSLSRQQIHATRRNLVATKKSLSRHKSRITTERMSQHSRDYCNKVEELEEEIFVSTKDNHDTPPTPNRRRACRPLHRNLQPLPLTTRNPCEAKPDCLLKPPRKIFLLFIT